MKEKDGQFLSYRSKKTAGELKACLPGQTERFSAEQRQFLLKDRGRKLFGPVKC